jgi:hypothetical protein
MRDNNNNNNKSGQYVHTLYHITIVWVNEWMNVQVMSLAAHSLDDLNTNNNKSGKYCIIKKNNCMGE